MQLAKNLFLWPDRSFLRKGLEAWFTLYLEMLLPKRRILELHLNVIEWGPGLYGAQASLLAAVLPNPLQWNAGLPSDAVRQRATLYSERLDSVWAKLSQLHCTDRGVRRLFAVRWKPMPRCSSN